jgi:hypothetical protein
MAGRAAAHSIRMLRSILPGASLFACVVAIGCDAPPSSDGFDWTQVPPDDAAAAAAILRGAAAPDIEVGTIGDVPLVSVTGLAASPHGLVVGGVSSSDDLFWDAWLVPGDAAPPRRLAPVDNLVAVDAGGALWTTIVSEDEAGDAAREIRLSPADGAPSVLLSPDLPPGFAAERAVADGGGGRLLIGTEVRDDDDARLSVFAVAADGTASRVARDPCPDPALLLRAALTPDARSLYLEILYVADGPPTIVKVKVSRPESKT